MPGPHSKWTTLYKGCSLPTAPGTDPRPHTHEPGARLAPWEMKGAASATREAAIRMDQAVHPSWPNRGFLRWVSGADRAGGIVTPAAAPTLSGWVLTRPLPRRPPPWNAELFITHHGQSCPASCVHARDTQGTRKGLAEGVAEGVVRGRPPSPWNSPAGQLRCCGFLFPEARG